MGPRHHKYLLIARVGSSSLHPAWLAPSAGRSFDVLLSAYCADASDPEEAGIFFEYRPGTKVAGYAEVFAAHADLISQYAYVALFDDDLLIDSASITTLFEIASSLALKIAQPALTYDSHFTYACLLQDPAFRLRYVNYIEMMCPVFRQDVFQEVRVLYTMGYESGIDLIWCNLVATSPRDFAVIDDVTVRHTRAVGVSKSANGFVGGRRYEDDIDAVLARFGLPWLSCVPYAGVRHDGTVERRRFVFLLSALRLVAVITRGPGWRQRARSVAVFWKHLMTRKAVNNRVAPPAEAAAD